MANCEYIIFIFYLIQSATGVSNYLEDACFNCGPNTVCNTVNNIPVCSCRPGFILIPPEDSTSLPTCKPSKRAPECTTNNQCPVDRRCEQGRCVNPCEGTCGNNAVCRVRDHIAACACKTGFNGDPFKVCFPIEKPKVPGCTTNNQCPVDRRCEQGKCVNPCEGTCGDHTICRVQDHMAACACKTGFNGNAFKGCVPITTPEKPKFPECSTNNLCPIFQACIQGKCVNPCEGTCGDNSICRVRDHVAVCTCKTGFNGDPFEGCIPPTPTPKPEVKKPNSEDDDDDDYYDYFDYFDY